MRGPALEDDQDAASDQEGRRGTAEHVRERTVAAVAFAGEVEVLLARERGGRVREVVHAAVCGVVREEAPHGQADARREAHAAQHAPRRAAEDRLVLRVHDRVARRRTRRALLVRHQIERCADLRVDGHLAVRPHAAHEAVRELVGAEAVVLVLILRRPAHALHDRLRERARRSRLHTVRGGERDRDGARRLRGDGAAERQAGSELAGAVGVEERDHADRVVLVGVLEEPAEELHVHAGRAPRRRVERQQLPTGADSDPDDHQGVAGRNPDREVREELAVRHRAVARDVVRAERVREEDRNLPAVVGRAHGRGGVGPELQRLVPENVGPQSRDLGLGLGRVLGEGGEGDGEQHGSPRCFRAIQMSKGRLNLA